MKTMRKIGFALFILVIFSVPVKATENVHFEQSLLEALIKTTIMAFDHPVTQQTLGQFSELIKNEQTYQYIIQKIDKFILTNELDEYEDQAEALKEALTEMRELYIRSEEKALKQYKDMKEQQKQREKQRELKANHVIEV